jgi:uncharacterized protein (TIGR02996 family)
MNESDALLAAIRADPLADPLDDTVRLAFADHLDEQGDDILSDHAAFIRVQIELARLSSNDSNILRHMRLRAREGELWTRLLDGICFGPSGLRSMGLHPPIGFTLYPYGIVRRGFVESIHCELYQFTDDTVRYWFSRHPLLSFDIAKRHPAVRTYQRQELFYYVGGWSPESDAAAYFIPTDWLLEMDMPESLPDDRNGYRGWFNEADAKRALNEYAFFWGQRQKEMDRLMTPKTDLPK